MAVYNIEEKDFEIKVLDGVASAIIKDTITYRDEITIGTIRKVDSPGVFSLNANLNAGDRIEIPLTASAGNQLYFVQRDPAGNLIVDPANVPMDSLSFEYDIVAADVSTTTKDFVAILDTDGKYKVLKVGEKIAAVDTSLAGSSTGGGVGSLATWNEVNTAMGRTTNHGKLFYVEDMDGRDGLGTDEGAFVYIINGSSYKIFRSWEEITNELLLKEDKSALEANDWEKLETITKRIFPTVSPDDSGTDRVSITEYGNLETQAIRDTFMDEAVVGKWYTVLLGTKPALINIRSGDKTTNFLFTGHSINAGPNGQTIEAVQGNVQASGVSYTTATFTGDIYSSSLNLPEGYAPTQYLPKATIEQMITNAGTSDYNNTLVIAGNQVERKNAPDDSLTEWRHGNAIASTLLSTGHPVLENSTIEYIDDYNNVINVLYTPGQSTKATLVFPEGIVNCDVEVSKITDWDDAWDGTGVPTGTDAGWKVEFKNPVDSNGAATTFHHPSTPLRMKLVSVNNETTVVDMPTDFFEDYDNIIGKSIDVEELWLQYTVADSLGNVFTNYGPHAPFKFNIFTLPQGRTIYDIEMIRTYSNNKTKWYAEYNGQYLPNRTKYLTKGNVDIFGDNCKIDVKINRVDDMGASWAEFNGWEIRPVIEGGVLNPGKVHVTNKGIYTASNGGNFTLLGSGHDIHYIVFKFKGGI